MRFRTSLWWDKVSVLGPSHRVLASSHRVLDAGHRVLLELQRVLPMSSAMQSSLLPMHACSTATQPKSLARTTAASLLLLASSRLQPRESAVIPAEDEGREPMDARRSALFASRLTQHVGPLSPRADLPDRGRPSSQVPRTSGPG